MGKRLTTEIFIEKARKVHGDKYDYSKVAYVTQKVKVTIGCKLHGFFEQNPNNHVLGSQCWDCSYIERGERRRKALEQFVSEARKTHGERYGYSHVVYEGIDKPVTIECFAHGNFDQAPWNHASGQGCAQCGRISLEETQRKPLSDFIGQARIAHGDRYDYSLVKYKNSKSPVTIICRTHGQFSQAPKLHVCSGHGCPECGKMRAGRRQIEKSAAAFLGKARGMHGDRYDYTLVEYKNSHSPITIICSIHGQFPQSPNNHLSGKGCPECGRLGRSIGEQRVSEVLSKHNIEFEKEKRFPSCRNQLSLPFDFFLHTYGALVEYDGEQHSAPIDYFGGEDEFALRQLRDQIKTDWAERNGFLLIRIPHTVKDIESYLLDRLPNIVPSHPVQLSLFDS